MMNHPYLRQEISRAKDRAEEDERERVLRLIDSRIQRERKNGESVDVLIELRRAVQQRHQR